ncbi:transcription elongation factor GreA [Patescibacteria group bacterium]|nr:transcription elongation factor GreA [Patescibacteria group bacterium]MBP9710526.1 transcription elongation factor GreA [Patescibacteria group bacterium]
MQLPKRRSQMLKKRDDSQERFYITATGLEKLKRDLVQLKADLPKMADDLARAIAMGDLSENAEYTEAKARLSRAHGRQFSLDERIKNAIIINEAESDGAVRLGVKVTVEVNGKQKTFQIVGPAEANPSQGRISLVSPLGKELIGKNPGDIVNVQTEAGVTVYRVVAIE